MPSQFGGIAVDEAPTGSQFGGIPVEHEGEKCQLFGEIEVLGTFEE